MIVETAPTSARVSSSAVARALCKGVCIKWALIACVWLDVLELELGATWKHVRVISYCWAKKQQRPRLLYNSALPDNNGEHLNTIDCRRSYIRKVLRKKINKIKYDWYNWYMGVTYPHLQQPSIEPEAEFWLVRVEMVHPLKKERNHW